MVEHKGLLYLFGGQVRNGECSDELFSLNLQQKTWRKIQAKNQNPGARCDHTMVSSENGIFICGGSNFMGEDNEPFAISSLLYLNLASQQMENNLHHLQKQMSHLYLKSLFSDVIFQVQDQKIFAHKMILSIRSQYFSNLFSSNMLESHQQEIKILDCNADTFKAFLKYIYCIEVDFTPELALDLFILCDKWLFNELKADCENFLGETLTRENIVQRAELAEKLEAPKLRNDIIEFIIANSVEMEKNQDLLKLPPIFLVKAISELEERRKSVDKNSRNKSSK